VQTKPWGAAALPCGNFPDGRRGAFDVQSPAMRITKAAKRGRRRIPDAKNKDLAAETTDAYVRLRESNHRIKNHLQVLASMLALQSRQSVDEPAREALLDACSRVSAVGRLHERLEKAEFGNHVDVAMFLRDVCADMRACLAPTGGRLKLDVDIEPASFSAERVLPLGLMVSELVTNAVKHAWSEDECAISVCLRKQQNDWLLSVVDNGPGMEVDLFQARSRLGGRLLFALAQQLGGSIEQDQTAKGASISVRFPQ
jgi:two-component sensor histidine kinase